MTFHIDIYNLHKIFVLLFMLNYHLTLFVMKKTAIKFRLYKIWYEVNFLANPYK